MPSVRPAVAVLGVLVVAVFGAWPTIGFESAFDTACFDTVQEGQGYGYDTTLVPARRVCVTATDRGPAAGAGLQQLALLVLGLALFTVRRRIGLGAATAFGLAGAFGLAAWMGANAGAGIMFGWISMPVVAVLAAMTTGADPRLTFGRAAHAGVVGLLAFTLTAFAWLAGLPIAAAVLLGVAVGAAGDAVVARVARRVGRRA